MAVSNHPWKQWVNFEVEVPEGKTPPIVVRRMIGMGTWLLRGMMAQEFEFIESEIEGLWRQLLEHGGFALKPMDQRYKMVDSLDPLGKKGEEFTRETENPKKDSEDYPRMFMENRMYQSQKFQKLHVGVGVRQDGLQFLHCLMLPKPNYDLPVFSTFIIGMKRISLAYVDLLPATPDQVLPDMFLEGMQLLQMESISSNQLNLKWMSDISSPKMISISPKNEEETCQLLAYIALLCKVYLKTAEIISPINSPDKIEEIQQGHQKILKKSIENTHLREIINKSFGSEMTDDYLSNCFFQTS
eukprot:g8035.t1